MSDTESDFQTRIVLDSFNLDDKQPVSKDNLNKNLIGDTNVSRYFLVEFTQPSSGKYKKDKGFFYWQ